MRLGIVAVLAGIGVTVSSAARAEGAKFGGAGQLVLSDDQPLGAVASTNLVTPTPPSSTSAASFEFASVSDNGGSGTSFAVAPAIDYFVTSGLSLGANVLFGMLSPAHGNSGTGTTITIAGIAPRVGYNIPLSETVSFWPKVYFGYVTASASDNGPSSNSSAIGVYAPFLFHPVPHFFIGIGPNASTQLSNNETVPQLGGNTSQSLPKITLAGVQVTLGGWFLGD
jgi:hypothetical protein